MAPKLKPNIEEIDFEETILSCISEKNVGIQNILSAMRISINELLLKITIQTQLKYEIAKKLKEIIDEIGDEILSLGIDTCSIEMKNGKGIPFPTETISLK